MNADICSWIRDAEYWFTKQENVPGGILNLFERKYAEWQMIKGYFDEDDWKNIHEAYKVMRELLGAFFDRQYK